MPASRRREASPTGADPKRRPGKTGTSMRLGPDPAAESALTVTLLIAITLLLARDLTRLGFFADDFHFLDVARRMPFVELLSGRYGIWPWYRPLSREIYFVALTAAGPWDLLLARALSVTALIVTALSLLDLGTRIAGRVAAAFAALLFVLDDLTKFLAGWASGFQDLLATALTLGALALHARGRRGLALAAAALAPFAKESGFLVFPLMLAWSVLCEGTRRPRRWMLGPLLAMIVALLAHALVRRSWIAPTVTAAGAFGIRDLLVALGQLVTRFVLPRPPAEAVSAIAGLLGGALAAVLIARAARSDRVDAGDRSARPDGPLSRAAFVGLGFLLGIMPLLLIAARHAMFPTARLAFAALPWLALAIGAAVARLPRRLAIALAAALVTMNLWGLSFRPADLESESGWRTTELGWAEAERIWARTARLSQDLRAATAGRSDSVVVLYEHLPSGSWFQTEDGPATREVFRNPGARAHFLSATPAGLDPDRVLVLSYDPVRTHHLAPLPRTWEFAMNRAINACVANEPRLAATWLALAVDETSSRLYDEYLRAAVALAGEGEAACAASLSETGLDESSAVAAERHGARLFGGAEPTLAPLYRRVLEHPRRAAAHAALADSLGARGNDLAAGLELRFAIWLDPGSRETLVRLADVL